MRVIGEFKNALQNQNFAITAINFFGGSDRCLGDIGCDGSDRSAETRGFIDFRNCHYPDFNGSSMEVRGNCRYYRTPRISNGGGAAAIKISETAVQWQQWRLCRSPCRSRSSQTPVPMREIFRLPKYGPVTGVAPRNPRIAMVEPTIEIRCPRAHICALTCAIPLIYPHEPMGMKPLRGRSFCG
jgi:hypothetical protein